jgi:hypothetical protein
LTVFFSLRDQTPFVKKKSGDEKGVDKKAADDEKWLDFISESSLTMAMEGS